MVRFGSISRMVPRPTHCVSQYVFWGRFFSGQLIFIKGALFMASMIADLAHKQYFFLWGYLKSLVYKDQTKTLAAWKNNICYEIGRPTSGNEWINWAFRNRHSKICHHALTTSLSPFGLSACRVFKTTYFKISRLDYIKIILNWIFFIGCFIIPNWKK